VAVLLVAEVEGLTLGRSRKICAERRVRIVGVIDAHDQNC
jgi:hypothetical protein